MPARWKATVEDYLDELLDVRERQLEPLGDEPDDDGIDM